MALQIVRTLFPTKKISTRLTQLLEQLNNDIMYDNYILIGIEKDNSTRLFSYFTFEQLNMLYFNCPSLERNFYEIIAPTKAVKAYVDFEYYTNSNSNIIDHNTPIASCLKIFHSMCTGFFNSTDHCENKITSALKHILPLEASTDEKVSYHFIDADPTIYYQNNQVLGTFIKVYVHILLISVIEHKCSSFNIQYNKQRSSIVELLWQISPYVDVIQQSCTLCYILDTKLTAADIANIIVLNKAHQHVLAIDLNVYAKYQQFRLFDSVKRKTTNNFKQSALFLYQNNIENSYLNLLEKSIVTYNVQVTRLPTLSFNENSPQFHINNLNQLSKKCPIDNQFLEMINNHATHYCVFKNIPRCCNTEKKACATQSNYDKFNQITKSEEARFIPFVKSIITSDPKRSGHITSCTRGSYRRNLLFFNIAGNYRYCPKKASHHRQNRVTILINTEKMMYAIRCKDNECDNTNLIWEPIK